MIESIGNLIRYIVILIFLATLLEMILPHGQFRRYLRMLVGILLILTILSPIQSIMRLAPGWDVPVFIAAPTAQEELALILQRGEQRREDSYKEVMDNYRFRLFTIVDNILSREFSKELVELHVTLDEDAKSEEFGMIKNLAVVARKKENAPVTPPGPVEEIRISVERGESKVGGDEEIDKPPHSPAADEKETALIAYLARYFLLDEKQVEVRVVSN